MTEFLSHSSDKQAKTRIALFIPIVAPVFMLLMVWTLIYSFSSTELSEGATHALTSVVIAAITAVTGWVGSILGYFFGSTNDKKK